MELVQDTEYSIEEHPHATVLIVLLASIAGGIAGGIVFGVLMYLTVPNLGMFKLIASLFIDSTDPVIGFLTHVGIAIIFGSFFALLLVVFPKLGENIWTTIISGVTYGGIVLWIIGPHLLMPLFLGVPVSEVLNAMLTVDTWIQRSSLESLVGHFLYGGLLALVTWYLPILMDVVFPIEDET